MKKQFAIIVCLALGALAGCQEPTNKISEKPPSTVQMVDYVMFELAPPTVLRDERTGSGGVRARVCFFQQGRNLPVTVKGKLDILLYEENPQTASASTAPVEPKPFRVWSFTPAQMEEHLAKTIFGWCYVFQLEWGNESPKSSKITLRARYSPLGGQYIYSEPATIQMQVK